MGFPGCLRWTCLPVSVILRLTGPNPQPNTNCSVGSSSCPRWWTNAFGFPVDPPHTHTHTYPHTHTHAHLTLLYITYVSRLYTLLMNDRVHGIHYIKNYVLSSYVNAVYSIIQQRPRSTIYVLHLKCMNADTLHIYIYIHYVQHVVCACNYIIGIHLLYTCMYTHACIPCGYVFQKSTEGFVTSAHTVSEQAPAPTRAHNVYIDIHMHTINCILGGPGFSGRYCNCRYIYI